MRLLFALPRSADYFVVNFYLITFTSAFVASILYTAVVRGKVALPCDISPATSDDSVALILWYRDDALAPIYTLDARKGKKNVILLLLLLLLLPLLYSIGLERDSQSYCHSLG